MSDPYNVTIAGNKARTGWSGFSRVALDRAGRLTMAAEAFSPGPWAFSEGRADRNEMSRIHKATTRNITLRALPSPKRKGRAP